MSKRPSSWSNLPYAGAVDGLAEAPMAWFAQWRSRLGDAYALPVEGPLLSRSPDCSGVIAVFGEAHQRAVLADIETYVLPPSAAVHLRLPPALHTLNAGLHSMRGHTHERHKQALARVLADADALRVRAAVEQAAAATAAELRGGGGLMAAMRRFALRASSRLFFGEAGAQLVSAEGLMDYFQRRREAAAPGRAVADGGSHDDSHDRLQACSLAEERAGLIAAGERASEQLRAYRRAARANPLSPDFGVLAGLARAEDALFDDDAFVGHANVLFISCNEPVAIALTWTFLALSQMPRLRRRLRDEAAGFADAGDASDGRSRAASPLIEAVHDESLRVLTPNALMVRVTRVAATLGAARLPAGCEVLLCPFLSHRDPLLFPQPQRFRPSRWARLRPSPYVYYPFGAGGHGCVGRGLALRLLRDSLGAWSRCGELALDGDAAVDWRVHVMLMPTYDPQVRLRTGAAHADAALQDGRPFDGASLDGVRSDGVLSGGVLEIVEFDESDLDEYGFGERAFERHRFK